MKCPKCGRELLNNTYFDQTKLNELVEKKEILFYDIKMTLEDDIVTITCPFCHEDFSKTENEFINELNTQEEYTESTTTYSTGGGYSSYSSGSKKTSSTSSSSTQAATSLASGSSQLAGDIDLPTYAELDYVINKMNNLISSSVGPLTSKIGAFSTMGLDLGGAAAGLSKVSNSLNSIVGGNSTLQESYNILKNVESKLRAMDSNYDLFMALGYIDNMTENGGDFKILGANTSLAEQQEILNRVNSTLETNKDKISVDSKTEGEIISTVANAALNTQNVNSNTLAGMSGSLSTIVNTLLKDYAKVTTFERRNGGLFIQKADVYTIGIPANYRGQTMDTAIFFDMDQTNKQPTLGAAKYNSHNYKDGACAKQEDIADTIMNQNPNTIVAVSHFKASDGDVKEMLNVMDKIGVNSGHTVVSGFSAGGNKALTATEEILKNHKNLGNPELFLIDCNQTNQVSSSTISYLGANNVKCTLFHQLNNNYLKKNYNHLYNSGIDMSVVNLSSDWSVSDSNHLAKKRIAVNDNFFGYMLGNTNLPTNNYYGVGNYSYLHYDKLTGNFETTSPDRHVIRLASTVNNDVTNAFNTTNLSSTNTNNNNYNKAVSGSKVDYDTLTTLFPNAKVSTQPKNGLYTVRFGSDTLYVPENSYTGNVNIVAVWPGNNGHENDGWTSNITSDKLSNNWLYNAHSKGSFNTFGGVVNNDNIHIANVQLSVFSASGNNSVSTGKKPAGGYGGLDALANFVSTNKTAANNYQIVSYDGSYFGQEASAETIKTLTDTNTPVYVVASSTGGHQTSMYKQAAGLSKQGLDTYFIQTESSNHLDLVGRAFNNYIPGAIWGQSENYDKVGTYKTGYNFQHFTAGTGTSSAIGIDKLSASAKPNAVILPGTTSNNQTSALVGSATAGSGIIQLATSVDNTTQNTTANGQHVVTLPTSNNNVVINNPRVKDTTNAGSVVNRDIDSYLKSKGSSLEEYNKYISDNVNAAGYHTREGVVAAAVSAVDYLYDNYNAKLPYYLANQRPTIFLSNGIASNVGSNGKSFDCSGLVTWALKNGGYDINTKGSAKSTKTAFSDKTYSIKSDYVGKPGDLIASNGHVQIIVATDVNKGTYTVAEASGKYGVVMKEYDMHSTEAHHGGETVIVDMTPYYNS